MDEKEELHSRPIVQLNRIGVKNGNSPDGELKDFLPDKRGRIKT